MGVPGFFAWLVKKYPENILYENIEHVDNLYLDWNGGIHPVCRSILEKYRGVHISKDQIEQEMIDEVIVYLKYIVSYYCPKNMLYIAIDGVAPRAKMNQQRSRRFKSAKDKECINEIRKRHKEPTDFAWDTNAITPGTAFMKKLCNHIQNVIENDAFFKSFDTELSDAFTPMEGEHKIISHIRTVDNDKICVIYGLDADLIFLSILCSKKIFLMRERDQFGDVRGKKPFWYMDICKLREKLISEMKQNILPSIHEDILIRDFVILCFFLGNDFIPKCPCLFIHEGGIDELLKTYTYIVNMNKVSITDENGINFKILYEFIKKLSEDEGFRLQAYHKKNIPKLNIKPGASALEIELIQYDSIWPPPEDTVKLGKQGWKDRYYKHFFNFERFQNKIAQNAVIYNYLKTFGWTYYYYTQGLPSWTWFYPYHHAPILSDVYHFMKDNKVYLNFDLGQAVSPLIQLLCVLPPQSFHLIPENITKQLSNIETYYPKTFAEDCIHKKKRWQTIPNIPFVDVDIIQKFSTL